jgi:hypothetical protein
VAAGGLTAAVLPAVGTATGGGVLASSRGSFLAAAGLAAACALVGVARGRGRNAATWAIALGVLAVADLALYHRNAIPLAPRALYTYRPPIVDALRTMGAVRLYVYDYTQREQNLRWLNREYGHRLASVPVGWNLDEALALGMQQSLTPATAGRWALRSGFEVDYRGLHPESLVHLSAAMRLLPPEAQLRLLHVGAVSHVVALHAQGLEALEPAGTWETLLVDPVRVFSVPEPLPRVRVVGGARIADGVEGLEALLDPGFDPAREIVLPTGPASPPPPSSPGRAEIVEERSDRLVLEADVSDGAYVALADAYDPGWRATLDGVPVPVLRSDLAFRAVRVPAGRHRIEMVYRPPAIAIGLAVSAVSLLATIALVARRGP